MPDSAYLALFLVGLLGGTHCVAMCGGIVGALSLGGPARVPLVLAYNAGRIVSYGVAGLVVGGIGAATTAIAEQWPLRIALFLFANLMLVAMGVYLIGFSGALALTERLGHKIWRHIQPLGGRFLPVRSVRQAFPVGLLWGWLPCGLVYSALATALASGSAWKGGLLMLAFGLGTLPNLVLAGLLLVRLKRFTQRPLLRIVSGILVIGFGLYGLWATVRLTMLFLERAP